MGRREKLLEAARNRPNNLRFSELIALAKAVGFEVVRVRGSHHSLARKGVVEILVLQEKNGQAKAYQVRQLVALIEQYGLDME